MKRRPLLGVLWSGLPPATAVPAVESTKGKETLLIDASAFIWAHYQSTGINTTQEMFRDMVAWGDSQLAAYSATIKYGAWIIDSLGAVEKKQQQLTQNFTRRSYSTIPPQEYKAREERRRLPDIVRQANEFLSQQKRCGKFAVLGHRATEADDVIATLCHSIVPRFSSHTTIVSPDKDFFQLISPTVSVRPAFHAEADLVTLERFKRRFKNLVPEMYCDYVGLCGDPVTRCDPRMAIKLLREHHDLETIMNLAFKKQVSNSGLLMSWQRDAIWAKRACKLDTSCRLSCPAATWEEALHL